MVIAGIDYSITTPAVCIYNSSTKSKFNYKSCNHFFLSNLAKYDWFQDENLFAQNHGPWKCEIERYSFITEWVCNLLEQHHVDHVYLEGYSMGSKGKVFNIAENTGIMKYKLWKGEFPIEVVAPTTIKLFATGKGNSNKDSMYQAFKKENPKVHLRSKLTPKAGKIISPVSDIVDAYFICKYGKHALGT